MASFMRVSKFLSIIVFITFFSLLYVYQQSEVLRLAYLGQKSQALLEDLLDKNTILRYNIYTNASLVTIGNKISKCPDFQMPDTYRLVRITPSKQGLAARIESSKEETLLSRFFGLKRQAEAKTINP